MEGVLVSAHHDSTNITVTVVGDATGASAFPPRSWHPVTTPWRSVPSAYDLGGPDAATVSAEDTGHADPDVT